MSAVLDGAVPHQHSSAAQQQEQQQQQQQQQQPTQSTPGDGEVTADRLIPLKIKINHGHTNFQAGEYLTKWLTVDVKSDGSTTVHELKEGVAQSEKIPSGCIYLEWMNAPVGRVHEDDKLDETKVPLSSFSIMYWISKFPQWHLICGLMPEGPVDPYVAIKKTVAVQMGRDPDKEVEQARKDGSLYHIDNWDEHKARYGIQ